MAAFPVVGPVVAWVVAVLIIRQAPFPDDAILAVVVGFMVAGMAGVLLGSTALLLTTSEQERGMASQQRSFLFEAFGALLTLFGFGSLILCGVLILSVGLAFRGFQVAG